MTIAIRIVYLSTLLAAFSFHAAAEDFTNAIHAYLQQCFEAEKINGCIVIGLVDEQGSRVVSCGKLDNGTDREADGDTVFEIASITKTFTGLLLQDMVERGEMKLDDPVAKYLPKSVKVPTRNGKEITLLQLVTHTSGLPFMPDNLDPKRMDNPYANYTVDKMYAFLSGYKLPRDPGTKYEYSGVGVALLAQAIALKAGTNYESLVVDRICRPLKMDSTRITLTPELKSRLAQGHNDYGYVVLDGDCGAFIGGGALCSTANDMLKYISANLGLIPSNLTLLMEKTHVVYFSHVTPRNDAIGLAWFVTPKPDGTKIIWHAGRAAGCLAFVGFDTTRRRGVVVLTSFRDLDIPVIGRFLLESEWQSDRRPTETNINSRVYGSYVGQYRFTSDAGPRKFRLWPFTRHEDGTNSQSGIGIRREGDRLFAQAIGTNSWPVDVLLPPVAGELLPESETRFFERLSGMPLTFSRDARGKVTGLTVLCQRKAFSYEKISDQPPEAPEPPHRPVSIKLDTRLLDVCAGHYEFPPNALSPAGMKLMIWQEGDHLVGQAWGEKVPTGIFDVYPESETNFFPKTIEWLQLTFIKNDKGEVTSVRYYLARHPYIEGKKILDSTK
jgi:CubicO group peptidase (beta-lactamase class C family)